MRAASPLVDGVNDVNYAPSQGGAGVGKMAATFPTPILSRTLQRPFSFGHCGRQQCL